MNAVKRAVILGLLALGAANAQPQWRHMQTEHFRIYSQANERDTREALQYFERVRSFFVTFLGSEPKNELPVYIVMFNSEKEYAPYRPNEFATAFYTGRAERDYIVMGKTGEQTARTVTHEYVHLIVRHLGLTWPAWLNEGTAELFSTLKFVGKNTEFGDIIPGRLQALYTEKWVPLLTILGVDHDSPFYNEKDKASNFYNQSWILVHMLATDKRYSAGFDAVQKAVGRGLNGVEALQQTYGKPAEFIESDLKSYIRGNSFNKMVVSRGVESVKLNDKPTPADMYDVRLALADLMSAPDELADQRQRLEGLIAEAPERPDAYASLAYLTWREGDVPKAAGLFAKAFDLGVRNPKLLRDLGRLGQGSVPEKAIAALDELVKLEPGNVENRLDLAMAYARLQRWSLSLIAARGIANVTAEMAPRLFSVKLQAEMQLNLRDDARTSAEGLQKYAKTDAERAFAARALEFLDNVAAQEQARLNAPVRVARSEPVLRGARDEEREETAAAGPSPGLIPRGQSEEEVRRSILHDVNGKFVELACTGDSASMVIETAEGRKRYRILEPNRIIVTGSADGFANLQCGAQKNAPALRIQFTEPTPDIAADGVVRAVHFPGN